MAKFTGPVPKRESERIRRNKPEVPVTKIEAGGAVEQPELGFDNPHQIIADMWRSAAESGQAIYYEPSDWQLFRFTLHFADQLLKAGRPSAQLLKVVTDSFGDLLLSEGSRRRVRIEVERDKQKAEVVDLQSAIQERLQAL